MAARRLLIVMLVLLGLSTLAAALVPQRTLRRGTTTATTTTQPTPTTPEPVGGRSLMAKIIVGGPKDVVVAGPVCAAARKPRCEPIHIGDQLTLLVRSRFPTQLEIRQFGLISFATPQSPARFQLLPQEPGTYGILYAPSGDVAARLRVLPASGKKPAKSRARGGSGQP